MFHIVVLLAAAIALRRPQFGPAAGFIGRAPEQLGVHKTLRQPHRMGVARLPILRQPLETQPHHPRRQIGIMTVRQNQKTRVIGHQPQTLAALRFRPANPLLPMTQMFGCLAKDQQGEPLPAPGRHVIKAARPPA